MSKGDIRLSQLDIEQPDSVLGTDSQGEFKMILKSDLVKGSPITQLYKAGSSYVIDSRLSANGIDIASTEGVHEYTFTTQKQTVNYASQSNYTNLQLTSIEGCTISYNNYTAFNNNDYDNPFEPRVREFSDSVCKAAVWNPYDRDIALTWDVPTSNNVEFQAGIDYSGASNTLAPDIYVRMAGYIYEVIYFGITQSISSPSYSTSDRIGIRVINGTITFFVLKTNYAVDFFTVPIPITTHYYRFKARIKEGSIANPRNCNATKYENATYTISGSANANVSAADIAYLKTYFGIAVSPSSTYAKITYSIIDQTRFKPNGVTPRSILYITHKYSNVHPTTYRAESFS